MYIKIIIDKNKLIHKEREDFLNVFIKSNAMYLVDLYMTRGYLYLNQIYERFELQWDPVLANTCLNINNCGHLSCNIEKWFCNDSDEAIIEFTTEF